MDIIYEFKDKYQFLSNMYPCPVPGKKYTFTCAESAFQSAKAAHPEAYVHMNGFTAKQAGKSEKLPNNWDIKKISVMKAVLKQKFSFNEDLKEQLIATGDALLIEGNTWHDNTWGVCMCPNCQEHGGANLLGELLMQLREELKEGEK